MRNPLASIFLRIGLAIVFLYAAIASFIEPDAWIGYFPLFLRKILPTQFLLTGFSAIEIALSLWILSGKKVLYSASCAAALTAGIIAFNFGVMDVVFRDFAILFSALALAALGRHERTASTA